MTKRNKILLSVLVAAVVALLIALCFVGNTFARYTLSETESVNVGIAEWGISVEDSTNSENEIFTSDSIGTIKPLAASYADASDDTNEAVTLPRQNDNFVCAAELKNVGAVDAMVQISLPENSAVTASYKNEYVAASDNNTYGSEKTGATLAEEMNDHFVVTVYYATESGITDATDSSLTKVEDGADPFKLSTQSDEATEAIKDVFIYFDVLWITDVYDNGTATYVDGDDFDSWAGTNVTGFSFAVEIEAYQAS